MAWFKRKEASILSEEIIERIWDVTARLKALESHFDASLEELARRYRRAEQSQRKLDAKKDCEDCEDEPSTTSPTSSAREAFRARKTASYAHSGVSRD